MRKKKCLVRSGNKVHYHPINLKFNDFAITYLFRVKFFVISRSIERALARASRAVSPARAPASKSPGINPAGGNCFRDKFFDGVFTPVATKDHSMAEIGSTSRTGYVIGSSSTLLKYSSTL